LGFVLCFVGAFIAGFYQSLHSTADNMNNLVFLVTVDRADFGQSVAAQVTSYIQQNVTPIWAYYLAIGIAMAIGGTVLVAIGDRKPKSALVEQTPLQSQPVPVMRQE
jgi:hypothetical protein